MPVVEKSREGGGWEGGGKGTLAMGLWAGTEKQYSWGLHSHGAWGHQRSALFKCNLRSLLSG